MQPGEWPGDQQSPVSSLHLTINRKLHLTASPFVGVGEGGGGGIYNFPNQLSEIREGVIMKNMLIIPYLSLLYHIHIMVNKNTMKNLIILPVLIIFLFKACRGSKYI